MGVRTVCSLLGTSAGTSDGRWLPSFCPFLLRTMQSMRRESSSFLVEHFPFYICLPLHSFSFRVFLLPLSFFGIHIYLYTISLTFFFTQSLHLYVFGCTDFSSRNVLANHAPSSSHQSSPLPLSVSLCFLLASECMFSLLYRYLHIARQRSDKEKGAIIQLLVYKALNIDDWPICACTL